MTIVPGRWCRPVLFGLSVLALSQIPPGTAQAEPACEPDRVAEKYPGLAGRTLIIGVTGDSPPYNYRNPDNFDELIGFNADYLRAIVGCIGADYRFEVSDFPGLYPAVIAGQADIAASIIYYRPERATEVDYVTYMYGAAGVVVRRDNPIVVNELNDLCGLKSTSTIGSLQTNKLEEVSAACVAQGLPAIENEITQGGSAGTRLVDQGRVDFYFGPATDTSFDQELFRIAFLYTSDLKIGYIVDNGQTELATAMQEAILVFQADGTEAALYEKYDINPALSMPPEVLTE